MSFLGNTIPKVFELIYKDKLKKCIRFSDDKAKGLDIYLRIKPYEPYSKINFKVEGNSLEVREKDNKGEPRILNYDFTQIFGPETTQQQLFLESIKKYIFQIHLGHSLFLATYGTSNAGKTYTILGNDENPGIIQRSIHYLFNSIKSNLVNEITIKPDKYCDFICLNEEQISEEIAFKTEILNSINQRKEFLDLDNIEKEECDQIYSKDPMSMWVSFAEIYNENIYDLLSKNDNNKKERQKLSLRQNKNGVVYIYGLKEIFVKNAQEALEILYYGRKQSSKAATNMNSDSSRSHCIFKISLLNQATGVISSLNICDLAGCERVKKTLNLGDRLKESQNINSSLLVLRRCLQIIRENQENKNSKEVIQMIPFRESKLTRLMQHALTGQEKFSMIVNINPDPRDFEETLHVLKFSAVTRKIIFSQKKRTSTSRFTKILQNNNNLNKLIHSDVNIKEDEKNLINNLKLEIENLKQECDKKLNEQRKDLCKKYSDLLEETRSLYKRQLQEKDSNFQDFHEFTLTKINQYREHQVQEKENDLKKLYDNYLSLEMQLEEMELKNNTLNENINEMELLLKSKDDDLETYCIEINSLNCNLKDKLQLIEEAKTECYELIEEKKNLEEQLNDKLHLILIREDEIDHLNLCNEQLKKENIVIKNENNQLTIDHQQINNEIAHLQNESEELKNNNKLLNNENQQLIEQIKQLENKNHHLNDKINQLENKNNILNNEKQQMNDGAKKLENKNQLLNNENEHLKSDNEVLKNEILQLKNKILVMELNNKENITSTSINNDSIFKNPSPTPTMNRRITRLAKKSMEQDLNSSSRRKGKKQLFNPKDNQLLE